MYKISKRQYMVLQKIAMGYSYKHVEEHTQVPRQSAAGVVHTIKNKYGFENREKIIEAYKKGLFTRGQKRSLREVFTPEIENILGRY